jgi:hypothetical protein
MAKLSVVHSLLLSAGLLACVPGCDQNVTAVAKCGSLEAFQSRIGILNAPQLPLGAVVALNKKTKQGFLIGVLQPGDADKVDSPPVASLVEKFEAKLSISLSADLPQVTTASIGSLISDASTLSASNVKRTSMRDPVKLLNGNSALKDRVKAMASADTLFTVVSSVISADKIGVGLDNSIATNASANVVKYGNFTLKVSYQCSNVMNMAGQQFAAFFKVTPVSFDAAADAASLDISQEIDLAEYNLTNGAQPAHQ